VKTPARPPRNEPTLEKYTYYDSEVVVQPNGERAAFTWSSKKKELGWVFNHWEDEAGFVLLPLEGRDDKFAQLLIDSECDDERRSIKHPPEPKKPAMPVDEQLGKFDQWIFPVIANMVPGEDIISSLVSVQPMATPLAAMTPFMHTMTPVEVAESDNEEKAWLDLINRLLKPHEVLKQYSYGGVLSSRGGYFVVNECDPTKVLRYRQTWLS